MTSAAEQVDLFFRRHPSTPVPKAEARPRLRVAEVPQTEAGLLSLAKGENWSAVGQLAEMLEKKIDQSSDDYSVKEKRLKLIQVRVTAAIKLQEYEKAQRIVDSVGGVDVLKSSEVVVVIVPIRTVGRASSPEAADIQEVLNPHVDPGTGRSIVPFSLLFLAVWVSLKKPDNKDQALQHLYDLLDDCVQKENNATSSSSSTASSSAMVARRWRERQRRVRRALVMAHFERQEFEPSVMHLNTLVDMASDVVEQMLLMQQVGCLSLRCGNSVVANEAFTKMKHLLDGCDAEEATPEAKNFCFFLSELNETLTSTFFGEYDAAIEKLKKLMVLHPYTGEPCDSGVGAPNGATTVTAGGSGGGDSFGGPPALIGPTPYNVMAANGFVVCHQYASDEAKYTLKTAVTVAEGIIKRHPRLAMQNNAVLYNIKALHNLEDDQTVDKAALMRQVTDLFRCGPECNMETIVP